ncbi:MAG: YCF48-related protein, partial [Gammaproteobacteria bacterium]
GDIFHTNDSGTTWTLQLSDTSLSDVFAIDANTAWAVGSGGTILSTDDAGATWVNKNVTSISSLDRLDAIDFVDGSNGWVVGRDSIANTSDAGSTWITQATHNGRNFWGVDFIDVTTGWAVGSQRTLVGTSYIDVAEIFHTSDGGNTWIEQDVGNCGMNCYYRTLYGVSFVDVQTGWAVGSGLFHTIDGGNSWNTQYATVNDLRGVHFLNSSTGWAVGENGTIIHTIDGGVTWNPQASGTSYTLYSVFALDPSTAWIAGGEVNPYRPVILKTSDGGATWQTIDIDNYGRLFSIYFADSLNGWAGGEFGEIFATQDGGNSWIKQSSGFSDGSGRISDIQFINSSTGWATAWFGPTILESISGGFGP